MSRPSGACPTCKQVDKWHQHRGRWVCGFCGEPPPDDVAKPDKGPAYAAFGNYGPHPRSILRNDELSSNERLVLLALADAWNPKARYIKISLRTLAIRTALPYTTVNGVVTKAAAFGWITKHAGRGHGSNRYRFTARVKQTPNEIEF